MQENFSPEKIYPLPDFAYSSEDFCADAPQKKIPANWELFASGRCAFLRALSEMKKAGFSGRIFLPHYFCPSVVQFIGEFCRTEFFEDLPSEKSPRFDTLSPDDGDAVMAVDFFGLRDMRVWDEWKASNGKIFLVENASHAPFAKGAAGADFRFGSLRKYLPLADGGFFETANPSPIFRTPAASAPDFSSDFLAASNARKFDAEFAERLFYSAEAKISALKKAHRMGAYSFYALEHFDVENIAQRRFAAVGAFAERARGNGFFRELNFSDDEMSPKPKKKMLCPVLKFESPKVRDGVYAALRAHTPKMFAPIYWGGFRKNGSDAARAESATMMCLPPHFADTPAEAEAVCDFILNLCGRV